MKKLKKNVNFFAFKKINSTNIYAKKLAKNGAEEGTVILAREQTDGKGRLGRTFSSKRGGLYFSVILRPKIALNDTIFITTAAAVAAARAIENASGKKCEIKWVNDIYILGKKVCGILTEGEINVDGSQEFAILGVGINLFAPKGGFAANLPLAGSVFGKKLFKSKIKNKVLTNFLNEFFSFYENIDKKEFIKEYQSRSLLTGKEITYQKEGNEYKAKVIGIDDDANLIVENNKGIEKVSHGEIQIIGMEQLLV